MGRTASASIASRVRRAVVGVSLASLVYAPVARAQSPLTVRGSVTRETIGGTRAVPRELVVLHRVNSRDAGAVDSVQTDAKGAFTFRVEAPDSQSMYLVSARYGGIAYFSQPMQGGQSSGPAEIIVYDTTSRNVRTQLQGRHVVVSSPNAAGVRSVIDVLEIENDTILTRVPGPENRPTYALLLPDGVENVHASQGEISDKAVEVRNGRAELFAPLSPGLRQLVLTYEVKAAAFPLAIPLEHSISVLEVLLEEHGASASAPGLDNKGPVTVDGKTFVRFLGASPNDNAVVTITAGKGVASDGKVPSWLLPLLLTVITVAGIALLARRKPALAPATGADARANGAMANGDMWNGAELNGDTRSAPPAASDLPAPASIGSKGDAVVASVAGVSIDRRPAGDDSAERRVVTRLAQQIAAVDALLARESPALVATDDARALRDDDATHAPASPRDDAAARAELAAYRSRLKAALVAALAQEPPAR